MLTDNDARAALAEMAQGRTQDEYVALVWAQRYPHPSPAASTGWPYLPTAGLVEMPSKLRKIK
jgi:hypothetical protein